MLINFNNFCNSIVAQLTKKFKLFHIKHSSPDFYSQLSSN